MEFDCKLAHRAEIKKLSCFTSVKELYVKIGQLFQLDPSEILHCTLNTHNFRDMNSILGNYLAFGDLIIVHTRGSVRNLTIKKSHEFLGLTITDNSNGRSFVKRVSSNDKLIEDNIRQGDHIAAINSESMIGLRHYEVAKAIRAIPQDINFTISLVQPIYDDSLSNSTRDSTRETGESRLLNDVGVERANLTPCRLDLLNSISLITACDDLVNSSLPIDKLLSRNGKVAGNNSKVNLKDVDSYKITIDKMNTSLECFLGISDNLLAIKIYRLARENKDSFSAFARAISESDMKVFNLDDEMKDHLWKCATGISAL